MHKVSDASLKMLGIAQPVWQFPSVLAFKQEFLGTSTTFQNFFLKLQQLPCVFIWNFETVFSFLFVLYP